ncbi:kynurenine aminotransferase-like [Diorhabda sublineata]|uniref:kynurenine aminotransferase-like n=1 Tax=Diorhabda sublineata TaxID=1163346 RepID=UPI0024E1560E|nr:kynurenine aminotransferase-like [Diorhabda sublineata]
MLKTVTNLYRSRLCKSHENILKMSTKVASSNNSAIDKKFALPSRYGESKESVWTEYIQLAIDYKPLNLGQGFPDYPPPQYIMDALAKVSNQSDYMFHQYTRGFGHPRLVAAITKLYSKLLGRGINERTELITTIGAYEALHASIMGHTEAGDEVIIIEPFYDCYEPLVRYAGGIPRFIPLRLKEPSDGRLSTSADWALDKDELESLFNEKTKSIIINNPNNPLGKVFTEDELNHIADLCKKWNVLCISDEVYEWIVYKPNKHIRIATLPDMWERTITIGSAGKTFSVTGWKLGWAICPANLMKNLQTIHQTSIYTGVTPIQEACAVGFELEMERLGTDECFFVSLPKELEAKRDFMAKFLLDVGMKPIIPEGGYFMLADWTPLEGKIDLNSENDPEKDYRATKWMTKNIGLQGIPPSAFYGPDNKKLGENYIRYCFIKKDENLQKAAEILKKWRDS